MHKSFVFLIFLVSTPLFSAPTEILSEGGVKVTYEQSGDSGQVQEFRKNILPAVESIVHSVSEDLGTSDQKTSVEIQFFSPDTYYSKFPDAAEKRIPARYLG